MAKAAKKATPKKKLARKKTPALFDGALPDRIPALDKQCERLMEAQAELSKARDFKEGVHAKLLDLMHSEKLTRYKHIPSGKEFVASIKQAITFKNTKEPKEGQPNGINPGPNEEHPEELDVEPEPDEDEADGNK